MKILLNYLDILGSSHLLFLSKDYQNSLVLVYKMWDFDFSPLFIFGFMCATFRGNFCIDTSWQMILYYSNYKMYIIFSFYEHQYFQNKET